MTAPAPPAYASSPNRRLVPTAADFPDCRKCQTWEDAGASWPRPCAEHYGGEPR